MSERSAAVHLLLSVILLSYHVDGSVDRCPSGLPRTTTMKVFNDRCFQFVSEERYWDGARDYCIQFGGRLVKIDDATTNEFIVSTLNSLSWRNNGVWIGLHDKLVELSWQWIGRTKFTHEPAFWFNWGSGHPKAFLHGVRDCVRMVRNGGRWQWHETPCAMMGWQYRFICEYGMRPTSPPSTTTTTTATTTTTTTTTTMEPQKGSGGDFVVRKFVLESDHHRHKGHITTRRPSDLPSTASSSARAEVAELPWALQSSDRDSATESKSDSKAGYIVAVVGSFIGAAIIVIFIIYSVRRRYRLKQVYAAPPESDSVEQVKIDSDCTKPIAARPASQRAESNVYQEANAVNQSRDAAANNKETVHGLVKQPAVDVANEATLYCPMDGQSNTRPGSCYLPMNESDQVPQYTNSQSDSETNNGYANEDAATEVLQDTEDNGMSEYDTPRPSNIYSEISDAEMPDEDDVENIYESLDQYVKEESVESS